ncbi:unnamed protein product [Sphagnum balticum]
MDEHRETLPSSKCSRTPQPIAQRRKEAAAEENHEGSGAAGKNNLLKEGGRGDRLYGVKKGNEGIIYSRPASPELATEFSEKVMDVSRPWAVLGTAPRPRQGKSWSQHFAWAYS